MKLFGRQGAESSVGFYGKHPTAADFLRLQSSNNDGFAEIDAWLSEALVAGPRLFPQWDALYDQAAAAAFIFRGRAAGKEAPAVLFGVLIPSRDRSGRAFPLVAYASVSAPVVGRDASALPYHRFLADADAVLARRGHVGHEQLLEAAGRLRPPDDADWRQAQQQRDHCFATSDSVATFARLLPGDDGSRTRATFAVVKEAGQSFSGGRGLPRYGLRCPVGAPSIPGAVALWLALLQRPCAVPAVPFALWNARTLVLHFEQPSPKALLSLWHSGWHDDTISDLASLPPEVGLPSLQAGLLPATGRPLAALLT